MRDYRNRFADQRWKLRLPPGQRETCPWIIVIERSPVRFAGLIMTTMPRTSQPLSDTERREVAEMIERIRALETAGQLPDSGVCWIWPSDRMPETIVGVDRRWLKIRGVSCRSISVAPITPVKDRRRRVLVDCETEFAPVDARADAARLLAMLERV